VVDAARSYFAGLQQVIRFETVRSPHLLTSAVIILLFFWLGPHFTNNVSFSRLLVPRWNKKSPPSKRPPRPTLPNDQ
jgi:hypothetical protein